MMMAFVVHGAGAAATSPLSRQHAGTWCGGTRLVAVPMSHRVRRAPAEVKMVDSNTVIAIVTALLGVGGGIGLVAWTENQGLRTEQRVNDQPCFDCKGSKQVSCGICKGTGLDPVFKSQNEPCSFCEGKGFVTCDNCNGTGIQPRFLDRLSPDDFMD